MPLLRSVDIPGEITKLEAMVASPVSLQRSDYRQDADFFARPEQWTSDRLADLKAGLEATLAQQDALIEQNRNLASDLVADTERFVRDNPMLDVDDAIDVLSDAERSFIEDRNLVTRFAERSMRSAKDNTPDALVIMSNALQEFRKRYNILAALARDARWKIMAMRSALQPSEGIGPVHGAGEPEDPSRAQS